MNKLMKQLSKLVVKESKKLIQKQLVNTLKKKTNINADVIDDVVSKLDDKQSSGVSVIQHAINNIDSISEKNRINAINMVDNLEVKEMKESMSNVDKLKEVKRKDDMKVVKTVVSDMNAGLKSNIRPLITLLGFIVVILDSLGLRFFVLQSLFGTDIPVAVMNNSGTMMKTFYYIWGLYATTYAAGRSIEKTKGHSLVSNILNDTAGSLIQGLLKK